MEITDLKCLIEIEILIIVRKRFYENVYFVKFNKSRNNMWWGYSQPLDLQAEVKIPREDRVLSNLEVLIVGSGDARHIVKTLASSYAHPDQTITYHVIEPTLEQVARSILLLSICLEKDLGMYSRITHIKFMLEVKGVNSYYVIDILKDCRRRRDIIWRF